MYMYVCLYIYEANMPNLNNYLILGGEYMGVHCVIISIFFGGGGGVVVLFENL